jgi:hypothetical protein
MIPSDKYLKPMLDAGSSRVFNCNDRARALATAGSENPLFFRSPKMHGMVLIKEANLHAFRRDDAVPAIATKIYLPYDQANIYEGGRSIFVHDRQLLSVLKEVLGLGSVSLSDPDIQHDLKMLRILDGLPSLDGFLMHDALEIEGIAVNNGYFEISDEERAAIREFIRGKFEPLVRAACGDGASLSNRVSFLIDKIWEANDKDALRSLIEAFRFPDDEALSIFGAWKGINFYAFEFLRTKHQREQLGLWLRDHAAPRDFVSATDRRHFEMQRRAAILLLRRHWNAVASISHEYEELYERFVSDRQGGAAFLAFLGRSREIYSRLGDSLSRMNHAIFCWNVLIGGDARKRLPSDRLEYLFSLLQRLLHWGGSSSGDASTPPRLALSV